MILVVNQKDKNVLRQLVRLGRHFVTGMRYQAGLKYRRQVFRGHSIDFRLRGEHGQEIQNV
jgi:ribosomal protein L13E